MQVGILLLHGFAGSRAEVAPLYEQLVKSGYIVSAPVLAGHESTRKALSKARHTDWINSARKAATELKKQCENLIVIGFSMGGLIAVNLSFEIDFESMVLINCPVFYWNIRLIIKNLFGDFIFYVKRYFYASVEKPFRSLLEFLKLLNRTKPLFSNIGSPVFIFQAMDDDTVHSKSARFIYDRLNCEKHIKMYQTGGHQIFESETSKEICGDINDIIEMIKET
jgi:carboxylesterase